MAAEDDGPKAGKADGRRTARERRTRPPVTIDLAAAPAAAKPATPEPSRSEPPVGEPPRAASAPQPPPMPSPPQAEGAGNEEWTRLTMAGGAGGLVALILVLVLQGVGLLPAPGRSAANLAADQARAAGDAVAGIERRVSAVEMLTEGLNASRGSLAQLGDRVARLEAGITGLAPRDQMMALSAEVAALSGRGDAAAGRDDLARLAERIGRLETAVASGSGPANAAVGVQNGRIDDLQADLKALAARVGALETGMASGAAAGGEAARSVALVALRRAAEGGAPFVGDLDLAAALGLSPADVAALRPFAERGVPPAAAIAAEMPATADAILAATAAADPNAGLLTRLFGGMSGLVSVRPVGPVEGNDPPAIVSRMRWAAEKGDLAAALTEREALPEAGRQASAAWAGRARDRSTVDGIIARMNEASARQAGN